MIRKHVFLGAALVAVVLAGAGWRSSHGAFETAYAAESCGKCYDADVGAEESRTGSVDTSSSMSPRGGDEPVYAHAFGDLRWYPGERMSCTACNACHTNSQTGQCSAFHCACEGDMAALADTLGGLLASGDAAGIRGFMTEREEFVAYDRADGSIVFRDCALQEQERVPVPLHLQAGLVEG